MGGMTFKNVLLKIILKGRIAVKLDVPFTEQYEQLKTIAVEPFLKTLIIFSSFSCQMLSKVDSIVVFVHHKLTKFTPELVVCKIMSFHEFLVNKLLVAFDTFKFAFPLDSQKLFPQGSILQDPWFTP